MIKNYDTTIHFLFANGIERGHVSRNYTNFQVVYSNSACNVKFATGFDHATFYYELI